MTDNRDHAKSQDTEKSEDGGRPRDQGASKPSRPAAERPDAVIRTVAMPADTNPNGDIFGGWLMAQMDIGGGTIAMRRAQGRCVTVAVDGMSFLRPVAVGDEVSIYATLVAQGRTSMSFLIEAWRRSRTEEVEHKVTEATFKFVAIDAEGRPRPLPLVAA